MEFLDPNTLLAWRAAERLLVVVVGGLCIVLGYRLFLSMKEHSSDGEGKVSLPGGVSIYVSRVGPGVFFALFGTVLLGFSVTGQVNLETPAAETAPASRGNGEPQSQYNVSYLTGELVVEKQLEDQGAVLRDLNLLNKIENRLTESEEVSFSVADPDTRSLLIALPRIKTLMLYSVWDEEWGSYRDFVEWSNSGDLDSPPEPWTVPASYLSAGT